MQKALIKGNHRLSLVIMGVFFISFSHGFVVFAEESAPVVEAAPIVEAAPVVEEVQVVESAPIVEEVQIVESAPIVEEVDVVEEQTELEKVLDETFKNNIVGKDDEANLDEKVLDEIFSEPIVKVKETVEEPVQDEKWFNGIFSNLMTDEKDKENTDALDNIFSNENLPANKPDQSAEEMSPEALKKYDQLFSEIAIIEKPPEIPEVKVEKSKIKPLHSCAFDNFNVEIYGSGQKSIPIMLKKSAPNKKFGLKVGDLPEGVTVKFISNDNDFISGEKSSKNISTKMEVLKDKAVNKEIIFKESVIEKQNLDVAKKAKEKEPKIDSREVIVEEFSIKSSADAQKGSFNIPIIYLESDEVIEKNTNESNSVIGTNCQFNLVIK